MTLKITSVVNGDQFEFESETAEGLADLLTGLAAVSSAAITALTDFKQTAIASGAFTGNVAPSIGSSAPTPDAGPPTQSGGATPVCDHGQMQDLAGKNYKHRYYCPLKTDKNDANSWKLKCKPRD